MTKIYIDADACPVKDETLKVASRYGLPVVIVANGGIRPVKDPFVSIVIVADGPDAADMWIVDEIEPGDICVTADIPLAAKCLEKNADAIRHNGDLFTQDNIGNQMATRDLMRDIRASNPFHMTRGGNGFTKSDRSSYLSNLDSLIHRARAKSG